ncbi:peptidoglycan-associated lipoprotein Pal [Dokdonella fugitiva]|jgi:peptidoglycan-associated lipoprotein|uniref:Peptidoglycan-associated lipoprotein n=1 Tax=Dokdonella fugitiva TaxID=328517 RepID=A0A4R2IDC2_9GAMM|nr:peptidoglycan-associated lipoprotein Pal [Dokdonella fugitiva]MBA8882595.1 peptidoglycan-associated lipoprotein [Dokdonella fugitiva]TCO42603.1 peptidoglycan-associated lipoprotein [Dokdonella fugitiva]
MNTTVRIAFSVLLVAGVAACAKKKVKPEPPVDNTPVTETQSTETTGRYTKDSLDTDSCLRQRVVYFDLDRTEIKSEFQAQIACHAEYLRQFPEARVTLEGNADERGSREYNLGLGERRGNAVQAALSAAGASSSQLNVTSYGEERPVCRQHEESCWSKNRRVEIVYTAK